MENIFIVNLALLSFILMIKKIKIKNFLFNKLKK